MAELYLIPYNEKIWRCKSDFLGLDWIKGRIPLPPIEDVIKSSLGIETEGYTHQLFFYYPRTGGIQSLIHQLEKEVQSNIMKSIDIAKIYRENDTWIVNYSDKTARYDKIVSTIPVMELARLLPSIPKNVLDSINALRYTSLVVVMLGLDSPLNNNMSWLYVPSYSDGRFNRVSFPSNFSPYVAPDGHSSILAETTCIEGDDVWNMNDDALIQETIEYLKRMRLITTQKIKFSRVSRSRYAYVINDLDYAKNTSIIYDYFSGIGIELCGRFAEFKYLNMDATIGSAIQTAKRLMKDA
jgi:protoporphyrinogen oxidase